MKRREHKYILDDDGVPIPCSNILQWALWYEEEKNRRVGYDTIGSVTVSTIFRGVADMGYCIGIGPDGPPPRMFETFVRGGVHDETREHYNTRDEAEAGHARWVASVRLGAS